MDIIYRSSSTANAYPLSIQSKWILYQDVVFEPDYIESLCKKGCRNYGHSGGCPPFSPKFNQFADDDKQYLLIITKFDSKYKTVRVKASKNRAIHWKFQDVIVAHFLDKIGRALQTHFPQTIYLGTGYCMGCPGQKCSYKLQEPCRNPKQRTFSMESTGINVVKTVRNTMQETFYWYTKSNPDVPYLMKAILLIFPDAQDRGEVDSFLDSLLTIYHEDADTGLF